MLVKEALNEEWRGNEVPATSVCRVDASKEVVKMGGKDTGTLEKDSGPSATNQGETQHRRGQVHDGNGDHEECDFSTALLLGIGPNKSHDQS